MIPPQISPVPPTGFRLRAHHVLASVLLVFLVAGVAAAAGIWSYFRLSAEANALRDTVVSAVPGHWNKQIALNIGAVTTGLVRTGLRFVDMEPEARAALEALRSAEVGVYNLVQEPAQIEQGSILARADKAMIARGWTRVVGVTRGSELVAIYVPRRGLSLRRLKCCLVVFQERTLVVVSARGNLEPLAEIVVKHLEAARQLSGGPGRVDVASRSGNSAPRVGVADSL